MVTGECDGEIGENKQFLRREKQDTGQNLRPRVPKDRISVPVSRQDRISVPVSRQDRISVPVSRDNVVK